MGAAPRRLREPVPRPSRVVRRHHARGVLHPGLHRDRLKFHLMADPFLQVVFDHVLGRDVVKKLMQPPLRLLLKGQPSPNLPSSMVQQQDLGTPSSGDVDDWDDKAALMAKQGLDQGLVASLLSMRGDLRGWGLGNIQETEDETLV